MVVSSWLTFHFLLQSDIHYFSVPIHPTCNFRPGNSKVRHDPSLHSATYNKKHFSNTCGHKIHFYPDYRKHLFQMQLKSYPFTQNIASALANWQQTPHLTAQTNWKRWMPFVSDTQMATQHPPHMQHAPMHSVFGMSRQEWQKALSLANTPQILIYDMLARGFSFQT